ncbi:MAG: hypothetical protein OXS33_06145 [bacterium]|nr:hypothetical protein [bacterium]
MKRTIRLPIVVVLSLALAMSAVAPAVTLAQEGTSPACAAAYAALARYYAGEITKAEADAAVALCEAESQGDPPGGDPPGDGQGGVDQGGGGQGGGGQGGGGQVPQPQDGNNQGQGVGGQNQGSSDDPWAQTPTPVTGHEWHEAYAQNEQYCGQRWRPGQSTNMFSGTNHPGQGRAILDTDGVPLRVTWRCVGSQWQMISFRDVYVPPATPPAHLVENWVAALSRAGTINPDICTGSVSWTITRTQHTVDWNDGRGAILDRFPFVQATNTGNRHDRGIQWEGQTVTTKNPNYDSGACHERRLAERRAAALQTARDRRIAEWTAAGYTASSPPPASCKVLTYHPVGVSESDSESTKRTRYYVVHVVPDFDTGDLNEKTLVNHVGLALNFNGHNKGSVWGSDVYFEQGAVINKLAELSVLPEDTSSARNEVIDCSNRSHDDVIPQNVIDHSD